MAFTVLVLYYRDWRHAEERLLQFSYLKEDDCELQFSGHWKRSWGIKLLPARKEWCHINTQSDTSEGFWAKWNKIHPVKHWNEILNHWNSTSSSCRTTSWQNWMCCCIFNNHYNNTQRPAAVLYKVRKHILNSVGHMVSVTTSQISCYSFKQPKMMHK